MPLPPLPTPEEIHAAYLQGEPAVQALFLRVLGVVAQLAERVQALEDQLHKDSLPDTFLSDG